MAGLRTVSCRLNCLLISLNKEPTQTYHVDFETELLIYPEYVPRVFITELKMYLNNTFFTYVAYKTGYLQRLR